MGHGAKQQTHNMVPCSIFNQNGIKSNKKLKGDKDTRAAKNAHKTTTKKVVIEC